MIETKTRTTINPRFTMKKILIDKSSINEFYIDANERRMIRNGQVKAIANHLRSGGHYSSPLVVNKIRELMKMVDGNHRFEAIKMLLDEDPSFSINTWVAVYSELNDRQEKEVYREWNVGVKQSATDFLKAHWNTIPMRNRLLKELPVSIYGDKKHLPIKAYVGNQIVAKRGREHFEGGYSGGIYQVVGDFQQLTPEDVDNLKEFSKFMEKVLGKYESKIVKFYTTTAIAASYQIWYDNKDDIDEDTMLKCFQKAFNKDDDLLVSASKGGGVTAAKSFYYDIIRRLNILYKRIQFKTSEEVFDEKQKKKAEAKKAKEIIALVKK